MADETSGVRAARALSPLKTATVAMTAAQPRSHPAALGGGSAWLRPRTGEAGPTTSSPRFRFVIGRALGTVVVTLHGESDSTGAEQLRDALHDLINGQGNMCVAVDLRSLRRVDTSCVGVFVVASRWAHHRGGSFRLHGPSPAVSAALDRAAVCGFIDVVTDGPRGPAGRVHAPVQMSSSAKTSRSRRGVSRRAGTPRPDKSKTRQSHERSNG